MGCRRVFMNCSIILLIFILLHGFTSCISSPSSVFSGARGASTPFCAPLPFSCGCEDVGNSRPDRAHEQALPAMVGVERQRIHEFELAGLRAPRRSQETAFRKVVGIQLGNQPILRLALHFHHACRRLTKLEFTQTHRLFGSIGKSHLHCNAGQLSQTADCPGKVEPSPITPGQSAGRCRTCRCLAHGFRHNGGGLRYECQR